ncbi:MAG: AMP-binding protein [Pirellulales bacterium]|nr:AMP-binding protein [Pirellulales bacterium]
MSFTMMHGNHPGGSSMISIPGLENLGSLLQQRALQFPDRIAFVYEAENGETEQWTYRQLQERVLLIAAWLVEQAEPGERALLVYPPGLEFIAGFFGCIYAGILPVPATYPKPRRPLPRAEAISDDCQPKLVLTHSSVLTSLNLEQQSPALKNLIWEATDRLDAAPASKFVPAQCATDGLAFLQYTSGSTSDPRGVMISHQNILHNLESIRIGFELATAGESAHVPQGVFWLPAYHDMGLIGGILTPIYVGGTSYLLAPTTFLRRPLRWLEWLSETQAEISGAPNFGYELAVQKSSAPEREKLDLHNWRLAFCGAEPINPATLHDFATAFAPANFRYSSFYPCYGMAEVTLLVTGGQGAAEPKILHVDRKELASSRAVPVEDSHSHAQAFVGCGHSLDSQTLKIVEPQARQSMPDGQVGEIWVRGGSVARGYWNQEELNKETFEATLTAEESEPFLRTGDLGFCWNGELFVTGRLKDVIIIRGRNYYPQDIERTAMEAHPAVDQGVAFAIPGDRQEQLVVVHQVRREHRKADMNEVLRAMREAIVTEYEIDPTHVVLIRPVSLPITSSGKVQRNRCRGQFLADELAVIAQWQGTDDPDAQPAETSLAQPTFLEKLPHVGQKQLAAEVQSWLIDWLTQRAHLNPGVMQPSTPFAELGIDSLTAVEISQELDQVLGLQLPPMAIWSCPTAEALSVCLAEQLAAAEDSKSGQPKMSGVLAEMNRVD